MIQVPGSSTTTNVSPDNLKPNKVYVDAEDYIIFGLQELTQKVYLTISPAGNLVRRKSTQLAMPIREVSISIYIE